VALANLISRRLQIVAPTNFDTRAPTSSEAHGDHQVKPPIMSTIIIVRAYYVAGSVSAASSMMPLED